MGYSGFYRALCANGHFNRWDAYDESLDHCLYCGAEVVWSESIDQTNGYDPNDETPLIVDTPAEHCTCKDCGNKHETERVRYKVPPIQ